MKIISKKLSIYFEILQELSSWNDFVCDPKNKTMWISCSGGKLNTTEQKTLDEFAKNMQECPDDIFAVFYQSDYRVLQNLAKKREYKHVITSFFNCIKILKPRLEKIIRKYLSCNKKNILQLKKDKKILLSLYKKLHSFFNIREKPYPIVLNVLLPNPSGYQAWNLNKNTIIVVPPIKNDLTNLYKILTHEYCHTIFFHNPKKREQLQKDIKKLQTCVLNNLSKQNGLSPEVILEEMFVSSLVPEGVFFDCVTNKKTRWNINSKAPLFERLRYKIGLMMSIYVKKRLKKEITFDEYYEYFLKTSKIILENKKWSV